MLKRKILIPLIVFAVMFGLIGVAKAEFSLKDMIKQIIAKVIEEEVRIPIKEAMT